MARITLSALLGASVLVVMLPAVSAGPGDERDNVLATTLAVQTALQQGRDHLLRGNAQAAVQVLESQLARINGNREYLATLRNAYQACIKELRLANKEAEAKVYLERLAILDPAAARDSAAAPAGPSAPTKQAANEAPKPAVAETSKPMPIARGKSEDPFHEDNSRNKEARAYLERAEQEFTNRNYDAAAKLFEQAYQADHRVITECRERWAYCKFNRVVKELNRGSTNNTVLPALEQEIRLALSLAPRMENFGKELLDKIEARRKGSETTEAAATVAIRHLQSVKGWSVAETANFRIHHNQPRELVEKAAQVAERTRVEVQRKWFGEPDADWNPKCDLFLYAHKQEYSKATVLPETSPGHSTISSERGRVVGRKVELHCDETEMLTVYLPHETTHVALAGRFDSLLVPRWADEGMAVLSEPRARIDRYARELLARCGKDNQLFSIRQLVQLNDYPDKRDIDAFYAQSVSLVEFLVSQKGHQAFTQFLRDGMKTGYEAALKKHYGFQDFNDLEQRWKGYAFRDSANPTGITQRSP